MFNDPHTIEVCYPIDSKHQIKKVTRGIHKPYYVPQFKKIDAWGHSWWSSYQGKDKLPILYYDITHAYRHLHRSLGWLKG